jgi:NAD(P)-dependent dehydrogenase (short-subunit alcohol dehydrogenase family)
MILDVSERMNQAMLQTTPLRRRGRVEEIAAAALYLASPAAAFVTGTDLTVDGGMSL